jgi:hypothetical protein
LVAIEESDNDSKDEEVPDGIILDLYKEMQELRSNRHGLVDRFSHAEKVHRVIVSATVRYPPPGFYDRTLSTVGYLCHTVRLFGPHY